MITNKVLEAMDARKVTLVVLLDLPTAFGSIDHATLLAKLQALGVPVHLWIGSRATFLNGCNMSGSELRPQACRVSHMESHKVQSWDPPCLLSTSTTFLLYQTCVLQNHMLMIRSYTFRFIYLFVSFIAVSFIVITFLTSYCIYIANNVYLPVTIMRLLDQYFLQKKSLLIVGICNKPLLLILSILSYYIYD